MNETALPSGKVAAIWHEEGDCWRACFAETPEKHLSFAGVYFYGGATYEEAVLDIERMCDKNDFEFVGMYQGEGAPEPRGAYSSLLAHPEEVE